MVEMSSKFFLVGLMALSLLPLAAFAAPTATPVPSGNMTIGTGTVTFLTSLKTTLQAIGPALSAIMFVLAGIIYAFGQLQPADARGKYQSWAMGLVVGGFVVGALSVAAPTLANIAGGLLT